MLAVQPKLPGDATLGVSVSCESVHLSYASDGKSRPVISDLNLRIAGGSICCILGESGCGKTSLLNMIAGFLAPSHGQICVDGSPISGPGPDRGMVFQDYSLFPWLTVLGNVAFGPKIAGKSSAECKALALEQLRRVGLSDVAHRYPFELSGGMKQRVAIARTLAANPRIMLMDEPFAALDALTRNTLQSELLTLHRSIGTTIVFVTHNIAEAIVLGDRAIVLGRGGAILEDIACSLVTRNHPGFEQTYKRLAGALNVTSAE
jgi:NitT/TauT family transport system ATP-binding protein